MAVDSISLSPRNFEVWAAAARKVFEGKLRAVFIECSFDNSQADACLYGHLNPRHLYEELTALAKQVILLREEAAQDALLQREASTDIEMDMEWKSSRKRKRMNVGWGDGQRFPERRWEDGPRIILEETDGELARAAGYRQEDESVIRRNSAGGVSPRCTMSEPEEEPSEFTLSQPDGINKLDQISVPENRGGAGVFGLDDHSNGNANEPEIDFSLRPLDGLLIVVNHVKDSLEDDVDTVERVYANLQDLEEKHKLGCTFIMAKKGLTIFF